MGCAQRWGRRPRPGPTEGYAASGAAKRLVGHVWGGAIYYIQIRKSEWDRGAPDAAHKLPQVRQDTCHLGGATIVRAGPRFLSTAPASSCRVPGPKLCLWAELKHPADVLRLSLRSPAGRDKKIQFREDRPKDAISCVKSENGFNCTRNLSDPDFFRVVKPKTVLWENTLFARYDERESYRKPGQPGVGLTATNDETPYQFFPRYGVSNSSQLATPGFSI